MKKKDRKKMEARERFYLWHGRFPNDDELAEFTNRRKPRLMFGFNTATR